MATWDKDTIIISIIEPVTGYNDTDEHTVQVCSADSAYPTGAITCTRCSGYLYRYYPSVDLDDEVHYDIYVDGINTGRLLAKKSYPPLGV